MGSAGGPLMEVFASTRAGCRVRRPHGRDSPPLEPLVDCGRVDRRRVPARLRRGHRFYRARAFGQARHVADEHLLRDRRRASPAQQQRRHLHLGDVGALDPAQVDLAEDSAEVPPATAGTGRKLPGSRRLSTRRSSTPRRFSSRQFSVRRPSGSVRWVSNAYPSDRVSLASAHAVLQGQSSPIRTAPRSCWEHRQRAADPRGPGRRRSLIASAAALARSLDPTRPVATSISDWPGLACQRAYGPLDVIGFNEYFGWFTPAPARPTTATR